MKYSSNTEFKYNLFFLFLIIKFCFAYKLILCICSKTCLEKLDQEEGLIFCFCYMFIVLNCVTFISFSNATFIAAKI